MIIDAHAHIWSADTRAYPFAPHDAVALPVRPASAEDLLSQLDSVGAVGAVCLQPRQYGYDHGYLADALQRYPDRLAGVCLVNPVRPAGPAELRHFVGENGFRGLRLNPMADADPSWLDGPAGAPLWETAGELGLVVSVLIDPPQLPLLAPVARRYPSIPILIDHLARCRPNEPVEHQRALVHLAEHANIAVKVSGAHGDGILEDEPFPYPSRHPLIRACYEAYGPERLLWGTDYPHILHVGPYHLALDSIRHGLPFIDPAHFSAILGGNAARIYGLRFGAEGTARPS